MEEKIVWFGGRKPGFLPCETNQLCFRYLTFRLARAWATNPIAGPEGRLPQRRQVKES